jgi:hypothetical protein
MGSPVSGIRFQAIGSAGPLPFAEVETYAAGTLTPLPTYTNESLSTPNATTVICDANGQADIWVGGLAYRFRLYTSTASGRTLVYDRDNYKSTGALTSEFLVGFRAELADSSTNTKGTGMLGHGDEVVYPSGTLGFMLNSSVMRGHLLAHFPRNRWAELLDYSTTYDASAEVEEWLNEISAKKITGIVPDGKFYVTTMPVITADYVRIKGASRPRVTPARGSLAGGSIFVGTMRFSGDEIDIENIGVDRGATFTATAGDGLVLSGLGTGTYVRLQNVVGLGRSADDAFHSILVEGYENVDIDNIAGYRNWYGVALKLKKANVSRVRGYENAIAGCILRSNSGDGICEDFNVNDVITVGRGRAASGSGGSDYGFYIVVDNQAQRIQCSNINARSAKQAIAWRTNANLTELNFVNAIASNCEVGFYGFTGPGDLYSAQLQNCTAVECTAWAMRVEKAVSLQVDGFFGMGVTGTAYRDELIRIESPVLDFQCDNVNLNENYGSARGGIRLLNAPTANTLGTSMRAIPWGNVPSPGVSISTQTGTGITLSPLYSPGMRHMISSQRGGTVGTVTSIGREYSPGTTRFPAGSILVVRNDDTQPLTISATAANVVTKGGAAIAIAASGVAMLAFDGANWVEV